MPSRIPEPCHRRGEPDPASRTLEQILTVPLPGVLAISAAAGATRAADRSALADAPLVSGLLVRDGGSAPCRA
jgi:hypothetical protein